MKDINHFTGAAGLPAGVSRPSLRKPVYFHARLSLHFSILEKTKIMKNTILILASLALLSTLNSQLSTAHAQGTAFTYQGRLNDGANPANGAYDLRFAIYNAATAGTQQGGLLTNSATGVSNGLFTVVLDFGNQFPGTNRWLEIGVRTNGGTVFTTLGTRQPLTAAPYAIQTANFSGTVAAGQITGTLAAANIGVGTITSSNLAAGAVTAVDIASNSITAAQLAPGAAVTNLYGSSQSGVASGGLVLSATENNAALVAAGYIKLARPP